MSVDSYLPRPRRTRITRLRLCFIVEEWNFSVTKTGSWFPERCSLVWRLLGWKTWKHRHTDWIRFRAKPTCDVYFSISATFDLVKLSRVRNRECIFSLKTTLIISTTVKKKTKKQKKTNKKKNGWNYKSHFVNPFICWQSLQSLSWLTQICFYKKRTAAHIGMKTDDVGG